MVPRVAYRLRWIRGRHGASALPCVPLPPVNPVNPVNSLVPVCLLRSLRCNSPCCSQVANRLAAEQFRSPSSIFHPRRLPRCRAVCLPARNSPPSTLNLSASMSPNIDTFLTLSISPNSLPRSRFRQQPSANLDTSPVSRDMHYTSLKTVFDRICENLCNSCQLLSGVPNPLAPISPY